MRVRRAFISETRTGTPCLSFSFENEEGETIDHDFYLSEKAVAGTLATMSEVFGIGAQQLGNKRWLDAMGDQLRGKECAIAVTEQMFNNKLYTRVKYVTVKRDLNQTPSERVALIFNKDAVPSRPAPVATPAPTMSVATPEPQPADDLPF